MAAGSDEGTAAAGSESEADRLIAGMASALGEHMTRTRLLQVITEAASAVVGAQAAATMLVDEERGDLWFEAAVQTGGEDVRQFRVPLGHGIAGLVATSGQAMAISGAEGDPRHASDVAAQIGYAPSSIVCVPLYVGDRVVGVLECLDKRGEPSFAPRDIEVLGHFANVAAAAIAFSQLGERITGLLAGDRGGSAGVASSADRTLALAGRLHSVAARGERELALAEAVVSAVAGYFDDTDRLEASS